MRSWLLTVLFSLLIIPGFSQDPYFRQLPLAAENPGFRINAICQDSAKFIWLATSDGIWKNDGLNFNHIKLPYTISEPNISALFPLPGGGVIAGTRNGQLFSVINNLITVHDVKPFQVSTPVSSIYVSPGGDTWFATNGQGLFRMSSEGIKNFTVDDGLGDDYIYCITVDDAGRLWVGSDGGLSGHYPGKAGPQFLTLTTRDGLPDNIIRQIAGGPNHTLGIGMEEKGFCMFDILTKSFVFKEPFANWSYGPVTSVMKLENEFWLGTQKAGIIDFEFQAERRIRQFADVAGFSGQNVFAQLKDHEGNIWIGAGGELFLSPGEKIEFRRKIDDVSINTIHAILIDCNQKIWFSNDMGIYCYKKNFKEGVRIINPANDHLNIISFYEDVFGYIWMGTFDQGVFRYNPETGAWRNFTEKEGLVNSNVLSIDGNKNEIWFATLGGVSKCKLTDSLFTSPVLFESYSEEQGLGNNFIYKVLVDRENRVWFGTDGKGITCYENGKFTNYSDIPGLKNKVIYSITEDKKGKIWLSSAGEGVYRFDGKSFRNVSLEHGLSDLNITSLITDNKGNVIIVHKKGVDALNPDNFYILSYGNEMGIGVIDPDVNVVDSDQSGNVWIGTINGIIKLKLEDRVGDKKPVLHINDVLCFLEKVDTTGKNIFEYNRNHISFDYTSIWYADPQKINYQYKLEGYNQEWITTRDRFVTFPNLRPGNYVFALRTSVNNNFNQSEIVSYKFRIREPFWQSTWFVILVILVIFLLMFLFIRARDKKMKSIERIKKEKIESQFEILKNQVNPHFLFNSFNTLITVIEEDKDVAIEYVNKLSDFFRSILTYKDRDLISLGEETELVADYVFLQQKRYGNNFHVSISISDADKKRYLVPSLALQILLENCLKHNAISRETKLNVDIFVETDKYLVVRNNINLKYSREPSTGIGLQNLRNRYRLIRNTDIIVEESKSFFVVKLPLILLNDK